MRLWTKVSTWVCLSLMLWTAAAESAHVHPSPADSASCSICVVAHSSRPVVTSAHVAPVFGTIGLLHEKEVLLLARLDFSDAGIRGPPVL
ncbi:MAG TPA: hypothetical protein VMH04_00055 [Candidatus Solibacter sp.]|nr:hypothetical protein [Candidatus Solibacter sp.]